MKKKIVWTLLLLLPTLLKAQSGQVLQKDFEKKVDFLRATFRVNDYLSIAEIAIDPENCELVAINDKMQALWRVPFKGSLTAGNFKGHILAIVADHADKSKDALTYTAYMVDEQTGKIMLQKVFYTGTSQRLIETKCVFANDGSWLRITMRETGAKNSGGFTFTSMDRLNETHDFSVFNMNSDLTTTVSKPQLPDGQFAGFATTGAESYFIFYLEPDGTLKALKYLNAQPAPSVSINQPLDMRDNSGSESVTYNSIPSETEKDIAYFDIIHRNPQKDYELSVCRLDFKQGQGKTVNEVLTNDHLKSLEKAFVRPDKKLDDAYVGKGEFLVVKYMADYDGTLIVTYGADFFKGNERIQNSSVINGYDKSLNLKFQQVMPNITMYGPTGDPSASFYHEGDKMYMTANYGDMTYYTIYGQLDLNTGKWLKLQRLDKDKLSKTDFVTPNNLWYSDNFVLFYIPFKNGLNSKLNFSLQSNPY